ncbi:unnamed protein product [Clonostachys rhizophaga]|uniref:mRNA stability protein n=1 Tax=Clonostachys rhizophaga TaxID=160324 RepID=A0A9N9VB82_9HYPO|nr:unnamed protein product [Clonostachys rhizophaga]CAH0020109.1 unnamed protein product [Clonostachys rhizophaga]CAH0020117.1 unnamed protein product [Clonostachys rhizophaga]
MYGRAPHRDLLDHQLDERRYFDSGDFALSQVQRGSDIGKIKTGTQHPRRESISHPRAPMPGSINVDESASKGLQDQKKSSEVQVQSHLREMARSENGKS